MQTGPDWLCLVSTPARGSTAHQRPVEASYIGAFADKLSGKAWRNGANAITRTGRDPGDLLASL